MEHGTHLQNGTEAPSLSAERKAYCRPTLTVYGDVVALTKNVACGGNDGPAGQFLS